MTMWKVSFLSTFSIVLLATSANALETYGNLLDCPVIDLSAGEGEGQTFLSLIQTSVKPQLDQFATKGYEIADGKRLVQGLDQVDAKVNRQVMRSLVGKDSREKLESLKQLGGQLGGKVATLYSLPNMIAGTRLATDRFALSTYIGLVSCGGSSMKFAPDNYGYNIHYGTGAQIKDQQTGRSFGASRIYRATDSSYTHYLSNLEKYAMGTPENVKEFVTTIIETLTNASPRNYGKVNDVGDAVLTDFFAIWTAEQTRNLMDGKIDLHWDAALLQVTLLAAFHAGQDEITLFYRDPLTNKVSFTNKTFELAWPSKNHNSKTCDVDLKTRKNKKASLKDYIGVHYKLYEHCGRSGINMSKSEWKLLGQEITGFLDSSLEGRRHLERIRKHLADVIDLERNEFGKKVKGMDSDVLREIARYLINDKTPAKIRNWESISNNMADLLEYVRLNANTITTQIKRKYEKPD